VILDGNFIHMSLKVKMDIQERIKKLLLGGPVVLYVPR
jgi:rRNA-processing protein FCF1